MREGEGGERFEREGSVSSEKELGVDLLMGLGWFGGGGRRGLRRKNKERGKKKRDEIR